MMLAAMFLASALGAATLDDSVTKSCLDQASTQPESNACATAAFNRADAALNTQWVKTYAIYKRNDAWLAKNGSKDFANGAASLLTSQRAWLTYRTNTCQAVESLSGRGTIGPMNFAMCMTDMTWSRVKELADLTIDPNSGEQM